MTSLTLADCRPEVLAFALLMEQEMRGRLQPGLPTDRPLDLAWRVRDEAQQLYNAVWDAMRFRSPTDAMLDLPRHGGLNSQRQRIAGEAALTASMAMLVAQVCGALPVGGGAIADVIAERRRQVVVEGWTAEHDDEHQLGEMALAGAAYAGYAAAKIDGDLTLGTKAFEFWPWRSGWWKPKDSRRDLVRAAALIIAELERLERLDRSPSSPVRS